MRNQLSHMLSAWMASDADTDWVLGTVYRTEGSAYRKAGAMMLINSLGQQYGLLSGGCLESDIVRNARKAMQTGQALTLVYDSSDEEALAFQLGIGCGGTVYVMLQPLQPQNDLDLAAVARALQQRQSGFYHQKIGSHEACFETGVVSSCAHSWIEDGWLITPIRPEPHLLVVGGGIDAQPLTRIAHELGWRVSLVDPRPANARAEHFPTVTTRLRNLGAPLADFARQQRVDAAVLMSHNIELDACGLSDLHNTGLQHIALLGPRQRYHQVLEQAGLTEAALGCPVSGPAGFDIGGQLPESIALSILSECHAVLHQRTAQPAPSYAGTTRPSQQVPCPPLAQAINA